MWKPLLNIDVANTAFYKVLLEIPLFHLRATVLYGTIKFTFSGTIGD